MRAALAAFALFTAACNAPPQDVRVLRIGNHAEPSSLDPHRSEDVPARNIQRDLFEGLVSEAPDGEIVAGVARHWSVSDDGLTWMFSLRPDARWSNGDPLTAEDFVFSFRRAVTPQTAGITSETLLPIRNAAAIIRGDAPPETLGVSAPDPLTLRIDLEVPTHYFLGVLTHPSTFPVHPGTVRAAGDHWAREGTLVSNGAYRLKEWRVQSHIELERNPWYHDARHVAIERVDYLPIEDQRAELARFEAGDLHITYGVPPGRIDWLRANYPGALKLHPWFGVYYIGLNTTRPPLDDVRVRRALSLAIDRDVLARDVAGSGETSAYAWIPAIGNYEPAPPEWSAWPMDERLAEACRLLADAGYGAETPLHVELLYNTRDRDQRIVTAVASMWRQIGVATALRNEEWKVYLQSRRQLDRTQAFRSGWIGEYPDPNSFAEILHSEHGMNEFGWDNPRYDELLRKATRATPLHRLELFAAAEREILADVPLIPLFHYAKARLVSPAVGGYRGNLMDHHQTRHLYWRNSE